MKRTYCKLILKFHAIFAFLVFNTYPVFAQLKDAANKFKDEMVGVRDPIKVGCGALALILGIVGLLKALGKSSTENENAAKNYGIWFLGSGIFAIAWASLSFFFR